ncbi:MAG: J domain-containing protein [Synergistaceae bacterium]|nr:J domain-containing protein [Synergistaceae bacterium]
MNMENMEKCYTLLGVLPTATAEKIEDAYQNKKREYVIDRFEQGTLEWVRAFATLKELDTAYDNAIMATFVPIQAFSGPMPKIATPQDGVAKPWLAETPHEPSQAQVNQKSAEIQTPVQPAPPQVQVRLQEASLLQTSVEAPSQTQPAKVAPSFPSQQIPSFFSDPELEGLVEEVPASFSDAELLNMDITQLRQSYAPQEQEEENEFFTLGIQDRLLRYYVKSYLLFAFFELIMRLSLGAKWVGALDMEFMKKIVMSSPSTLTWIVSAFISTTRLFCCALPLPIVTRFFFLAQPAENNATHGMLVFLSLVAAIGLYFLTGFLFEFLPISWDGTGMNFAFIAPVLCWGTMRYEDR